jgi:hypothetical protein
VKGPKPAVVFGKIGREGLGGSGNTEGQKVISEKKLRLSAKEWA